MAQQRTPTGVRTGRVAAALTAVSAVVSLAVGVTTPARSGPYCRSGCVGYPYTDAAAFVPRDYLWMYPALAMVLAFLVLAVTLHAWVPPDRRVDSGIGVCLTVLGSGVLVVDYALQVTVLQPGLASGETAGLSVLSQYNPHGVFIGLENVGYTMLNLAFVFLGLALAGETSGRVRVSGWVLRVGGTLTLLALVGYAATYGLRLDSRYEVAALAVTWLVLTTAGTLLALDRRSSTPATAGRDRPAPAATVP